MMSSGEKIKLEKAQTIAATVLGLIADVCDQVVIAGSVRRRRLEVGDIEIVALPKDARALNARLDKLVIDRVISRAAYGKELSHRWGEKYRGFTYEGVRVEVFTADVDNWGYILWLRTGPGDANQYVMMMCSQKDAPYRAKNGYWWHDGRKLHVANETEMFRLLGMNVVPPPLRKVDAYQQHFRNFRWGDAAECVYAEMITDPSQLGLW